MKHLKSLLSLSLIIAFISSTSALPAHPNHTESINSTIEHFLTDIDFESDGKNATIFVDFIISDNGDLYTVDFVVTESDEVIVLSEDFEEEWYRVDSYSTVNMKKYSVPVFNILI